MGLMFPKKPKLPATARGEREKRSRYTNEGHLKFVREWSCAFAGRGECEGPVEAHHLLKPWYGERGMGRKAADCCTLPLCSSCHRALHRRGDEEAFFKEQAGHAEFGRMWSQHIWMESPYFEVLP